MRETYSQPPYSDAAETNPVIDELIKKGRTFICGVVDEHPPTEVVEFPGHNEVSLGPTLGYVRHPLGEDRMVWVGHTLVFDPDRFEAKVKSLAESGENADIQDTYETEGWEVLPSTPDRLVLIHERA